MQKITKRLEGIIIAMAATSHLEGCHRFKLDTITSMMKKYERTTA